MLETQISQVSQQQAATVAPAGTFPGQPQPNPKGHANAITLWSGTKLDRPVDPRVENPIMYKRVEDEPEKVTDENQVRKTIVEEEETITNKYAIEKEKPYVPPPLYKPKIPYPQRLAKTKNEGQFKIFFELLKQLYVTIPFSDAITQMPSYAKFLKKRFCRIRRNLKVTRQLHSP